MASPADGVTIYHNPNCNSSQNAVRIAEELGVAADIVLYLKTPPDAETLRSIIAKLEDPVADLVRRDGWTDLGIAAADVADEDGVVRVLLAHPTLLQRPIIVRGDRAVIGRPTERVGEILGA